MEGGSLKTQSFTYCHISLFGDLIFPSAVQVEKLILEDSRISQYPKLIKGESKIVLEWQGRWTLFSASYGLPFPCIVYRLIVLNFWIGRTLDELFSAVEGSLGPKVRRKEASMNTEIKKHHSISSTYKQKRVKECDSLYTWINIPLDKYFQFNQLLATLAGI